MNEHDQTIQALITEGYTQSTSNPFMWTKIDVPRLNTDTAMMETWEYTVLIEDDGSYSWSAKLVYEESVCHL